MPINSNDVVDALVAEGQYEAAARRAQADGLYDRAAALYERIWQFDMAAAAAVKGGDPARALKNAIEARNDELIDTLVTQLRETGETGVATAVDALEKGRRFDAAARLAGAG